MYAPVLGMQKNCTPSPSFRRCREERIDSSDAVILVLSDAECVGTA